MNTPPPTSFNVLLLGDACIDKYHYGFCERLSPEAPVPVLRHTRTEERDGMCLNVKNNLIAFGIRPDTYHNSMLLSKERFVDSKTKQHLMRFDKGEVNSSHPFSVSTLKKLDIKRYDVVVVSDYNKGFIPDNVATLLAELCTSHTIPLFVDSKKRDLSCYENAYLKINQKEYAEVKKFPLNYELIVTLGPDGARWNDQIFKTAPCEVFDVSGAGDTFLAAMVAEYLKTKSLPKAIEFANRCAGIVVQKFGLSTTKSIAASCFT